MGPYCGVEVIGAAVRLAGDGKAVSNKTRVVVWNEFRHEQQDQAVIEHYPEGIHETIAGFLRKENDLEVATAWLDQPEHGLSEERLAATDVLIWWGHKSHDEVADEVAERVQRRVLEGMGLIALHSAHFAKVFKRLMGTGCTLRYREATDKERIWVIERGHPIARGLDEYFEIPVEEMYSEQFGIPAPDELIFISWFSGGEVLRSGACWRRGNGKVFYFRPGHETHPTYHQPEVQTVIKNAVRWAAPNVNLPDVCHAVEPREELPG